MATLAQVTSETRIILKIAGALFALLFVLFMFVKGGEIVKKVFFPSPPQPPDEKFGKLPSISFPTQKNPSYSFKINTITGKLPVFPDRMKVYKVVQDEPNLSALSNTRTKIKSIGYTDKETKLSDTKYEWSKSSGEYIVYDTLTNNFWVNSNYLNASSALGYLSLKKDDAIRNATIMMGNLKVDTSDLDDGKTSFTFYKIVDRKLVKVDSQNDAEVARLDFFQKDAEQGTSIYYPDLPKSIIYFIFGVRGGLPQILEAQFNHYPLDKTNFATYGIKTADSAYEDLKNGKGYFIMDNQIKKNSSVVITDLSLGYYIGEGNQKYVMPIAVFQGNGFVGYIPLIPEDN